MFNCMFLQFFTEGNSWHSLTPHSGCATRDTVSHYKLDSHTFFDRQIPNGSRRKCSNIRPSKRLSTERKV